MQFPHLLVFSNYLFPSYINCSTEVVLYFVCCNPVLFGLRTQSINLPSNYLNFTCQKTFLDQSSPWILFIIRLDYPITWPAFGFLSLFLVMLSYNCVWSTYTIISSSWIYQVGRRLKKSSSWIRIFEKPAPWVYYWVFRCMGPVSLPFGQHTLLQPTGNTCTRMRVLESDTDMVSDLVNV